MIITANVTKFGARLHRAGDECHLLACRQISGEVGEHADLSFWAVLAKVAVAFFQDFEDLRSIDLDRAGSPVDRASLVVAFLGVPFDRQVEPVMCTGIQRGAPPRASQLIDWAQQGEAGTVQIGVAGNPPLEQAFARFTQTLSP